MKATVWISGCDDVTRLDLNVNDAELAAFKRLERASLEESEVSCQPIVRVKATP